MLIQLLGNDVVKIRAWIYFTKDEKYPVCSRTLLSLELTQMILDRFWHECAGCWISAAVGLSLFG